MTLDPARPAVSIIIPTCHRPAELALCLRALEPQLPPARKVEVLVLDDGRLPETREMLQRQFPWARWHAGPHRGPAANRNAGAAAARGEWLVFLDDDCIPRPGWLEAYVRAFAIAGASEACLAGATFRFESPRSLLWEAPHNPEGRALISCNMAASRDLFLRIGRFDERYPVAAFEDTEFEARARRLAIGIRFVEARVDHPLRPLPAPRQLAARWEAKVIYARDLGASSFRILWGLPWHVLRVIPTRFRNGQWSAENWIAAGRFTREWLLVLQSTPGWIRKWAPRPRSPFWASQPGKSCGIPKYGF